MKPKLYKILKNCATEHQTYFGGEIVMVPQEVDLDLIQIWVSDGIAESIEPEKPAKPQSPKGKDKKAEAPAETKEPAEGS